MTKLLLTILAFTAINLIASAQQSDLGGSKRYIKIVIDSEITREAESEITNAFRQIPGVRTSRMDKVTGVFLGIYIPGDQLKDETFMNWFLNHGYEIACYYDAAYVEGSMIELSKNNCR